MAHKNPVHGKRNGITLLITVMATGVLLPIAGLAVDASLLYAVKAKLQAAVDAGSLAGARSLNRGLDLSSQTESAYRTRTVSTDASVDAPAYFMRVLGFRSTQLWATGTASRRDVNLVLVLDRSWSMGAP